MKWRNATHAFVGNLQAIMTSGTRISVRAHDTLELLNSQIELQHPLERCIIVPHRRNNIFASIAETMWVLAGRNDIGFLSHYLKRAQDFSDDGTTWRAGYGPRIRNWRGIDQLTAVAKILTADRNTRRAVMSIFDPGLDYIDSRDIPCNNWIHCFIREDALHVNVAVRSNDIMWGFSGINTFEWSVVQEILAHWSGVRVGTATFFVSSLHLYSRHERRALRIIDAFPGLTCYETGIATAPFQTSMVDFDETLRRWFELEADVRENPERNRASIDAYPDPLFRHFLQLLRIYAGARLWPPEVIKAELASLPETDLTLAAYEYLSRDNEWRLTPSDVQQARLATYWAVFNSRVNSPAENDFADRLRVAISRLHAEKSYAYGDSWKRRGEILGVGANIARKVDRLERALTIDSIVQLDETLLDTAVDLLVYAIKYITFLADQDQQAAALIFADSSLVFPFSEGTRAFDRLLERVDFRTALQSEQPIIEAIRAVMSRFATVENHFGSGIEVRVSSAKHLLEAALHCVTAVVRQTPKAVLSSFLSRYASSSKNGRL